MNGRKVVESKEAPKAIGPYSQAVRAGDWIFLSGQIGLDPESGLLVEGGLCEETRRALKNLEGVLRAAGMDLGNVVKTTVYMTDLSKFNEMNEIYAQSFPAPSPARAAVEVRGLPKGALVEIDAVACAAR